MIKSINIVWFKRDLRVVDHAALVNACSLGNVMPLFCWEPIVWAGDDYALQHQAFVGECLAELSLELQNLGLNLQVSNIGMLETLNIISQQYNIVGIYSHEETGNGATFNIDKQVAAWCKYNNVPWQETPQNGVVRRLKNRNYWNKHWEQRMNMPLLPRPISTRQIGQIILPDSIKHYAKPIASGQDKLRRQRGGRKLALEIFNSFLDGRAAKFRGGISSPLSAVTAGSRLSPYLAYGCLSMGEVVQATRDRRAWAGEVPHMFPKSLNGGLIGFESRLHWHCHFMQKLESEPEMEFENQHHAHDGMRDENLSDVESQRRLQAWSSGQTGWPLVDDCMAMLRETGWVNFRMRAMLMSTASYLYWLHWRGSGLHLAREFLDYEPGIHWSQSQMQSGTTGINTLRVYSPVKQAQDQDPTGAFVRHWLPALKNVPDGWIFEPHLMPKILQQQYGCVLEKDYPAPIVDIAQAMRKGMLVSGRDNNGLELAQKKSEKKSKLIKIRSSQQTLF